MKTSLPQTGRDTLSNTEKTIIGLGAITAFVASYGWVVHPTPAWVALLLPAVLAMNYTERNSRKQRQGSAE